MRTLWHGTTRLRGEAIVRDGPDPTYREPNSAHPAEGFSAAPPGGPYLQGDPAIIAKGKSALFPHEGGPVILEFSVPEDIAAMANFVVEVRFMPAYGLEELLKIWPQLPNRLIDLSQP